MFSRLKTIQWNYVICITSLYLIKTLVFPINAADSVIFVGLLGLIGLQKYIVFKEPKVTPFDIFKAEVEAKQKNSEETIQELRNEITVLASNLRNTVAKINLSDVTVKMQPKSKNYF